MPPKNKAPASSSSSSAAASAGAKKKARVTDKPDTRKPAVIAAEDLAIARLVAMTGESEAALKDRERLRYVARDDLADGKDHDDEDEDDEEEEEEGGLLETEEDFAKGVWC